VSAPKRRPSDESGPNAGVPSGACSVDAREGHRVGDDSPRRSRQDRQQCGGLDGACVNHRVVVRAEGDDVAEVVGASARAGRDVVHVEGEGEPADAACSAIAFECLASPVAVRPGHRVGEPNGDGEGEALCLAAGRGAVGSAAAVHSARPDHDLFLTLPAVGRDVADLCRVLSAPRVVAICRAEVVLRRSPQVRCHPPLHLPAAPARDSEGRPGGGGRGTSRFALRLVAGQKASVLASQGIRRCAAPTAALPDFDLRAHFDAASSVRRTHCESGSPSRVAAEAKRSASATDSRMLRFFVRSDFDSLMARRYRGVPQTSTHCGQWS